MRENELVEKLMEKNRLIIEKNERLIKKNEFIISIVRCVRDHQQELRRTQEGERFLKDFALLFKEDEK